MILNIIEWIGTILVLAGILFIASPKASDPIIRIYGLCICMIGCTLLGVFAFIIGAYGVLSTQAGVFIIDVYGLYNCRKEIKNKND